MTANETSVEAIPAPASAHAASPLSVPDLIHISLCDDAVSRLARAFVGDARSSPVCIQPEPLEANIMLEALDSYLEARQHTTLAAYSMPSNRRSSGELGPPRRSPIEIRPNVRRLVLRDAIVFLSAPPDMRVVLTVEEDVTAPGCLHVTVYSSGIPALDWINDWQRYSLDNAYVRGQRIFPDGTPLRHDTPVLLSDVCVPDDVAELVQRVIFRFPENAARFRERGLPAKRGVLLTGAPGTGKTMLARAIAHAFPGTCIWVTPRHVVNSSEVAQVWTLAHQLAPTLIVMEDLDLYGESRMTCDRTDVLGELMNQMDGAEANDGILTLATTNCADAIEQAIRNRPGRFDKVLRLSVLDPRERRRMLETLLTRDEIDACSMDSLLEQTNGFSGAQIVEFAKSLLEFSAHLAPGAPQSNRPPAVAASIERHCRPIGSRIGFSATGQS